MERPLDHRSGLPQEPHPASPTGAHSLAAMECQTFQSSTDCGVFPIAKSIAILHARSVAISVLVVDDDATFRDTARELLRERGYLVVGEAATVKEAHTAVTALDPDVVLLDITLPDGDGIALATELSKAALGPRVLLTSSDDRLAPPEQVELCGASGFVPKSELPSADLDLYLKK
jgi:CheY-like chemotaxis protein